VNPNVDHVIPQALGGSDKPDNLVTACADCNAGKTSSMPNAMPVADVDQAAFRQAADSLSDHVWRGGYPLQWGTLEVERHAAETAWGYAWSVASKGENPSQHQYDEFLAHSASLFERGFSVAEVISAAVHAGSQLTGRLSWGLGATDLQYAPISGEQFSRIEGVYDGWVETWRQYEGPDPTAEERAVFRGELILAVRSGKARDDIQIASGMAGASHSAGLNVFIDQWEMADITLADGEA
jgi:hypothetical protein